MKGVTKAVADVQAAGCYYVKHTKANGLKAYCDDGGYHTLWVECMRPGGKRYWSIGNRENYEYSEAFCGSKEFRTGRDIVRG